ncbi:MAG: hypothetical protein HYY83_01445 [Deltaproteobacteria bacterium]|nr:hypothetical protein [Deltaproteobacteria bacterium]
MRFDRSASIGWVARCGFRSRFLARSRREKRVRDPFTTRGIEPFLDRENHLAAHRQQCYVGMSDQ